MRSQRVAIAITRTYRSCGKTRRANQCLTRALPVGGGRIERLLLVLELLLVLFQSPKRSLSLELVNLCLMPELLLFLLLFILFFLTQFLELLYSLSLLRVWRKMVHLKDNNVGKPVKCWGY